MRTPVVPQAWSARKMSSPLRSRRWGVFLQGHDLDAAHIVVVAQAAVGDRADAARSAAKKSAQGRFHKRARIAAQLPPRLARRLFNRHETSAGFRAAGAFGSDFQDAGHAAEIEHDAAIERDALAVVSGSGTANRDGNVVTVSEAQSRLDLVGRFRQHDGVTLFVVELPGQKPASTNNNLWRVFPPERRR